MNSSSKTTNSGKKANNNGANLENSVEDYLVRKGYSQFTGKKGDAENDRNILADKTFIKQFNVGETIYGSTRKVDFFIKNRNLFEHDLVIECKWQQVAGSVDEKFPFLLHNINKSKIPTIIILDGDGYKPEAKNWLLEQRKRPENQALLNVWSMNEFMRAINDGFLD